MPISITKENFEQDIQQASKPVVLDVYATWCGPCLQMAPIFEELEKEMGNDYIFAKLNVDEAREISIGYGVSSIPTFLFIKDGNVIGKEIGYMSKANLQTKITEYLG